MSPLSTINPNVLEQGFLISSVLEKEEHLKGSVIEEKTSLKETWDAKNNARDWIGRSCKFQRAQLVLNFLLKSMLVAF